MNPRIYTYKVTFEEIPDWYWGVHKEKKFGEHYLGSPSTNKWKWDFYTPKLQVLEEFPYSEEGWIEANLLEDRLIAPDINNIFCLNEHFGGVFSLRVCSEAGRLGGKIGGKIVGKMIHEEKNEEGKSVLGVKFAERLNQEKNSEGKSANAIKGAEKAHEIKTSCGKSVTAVKGGVAAAVVIHKDRDENGKSLHAVNMGKKAAIVIHSQKWIDPSHPELGVQNCGNLVQMQKRRGYPHGPENRVKIEKEDENG
jgi:hypothetical protein